MKSHPIVKSLTGLDAQVLIKALTEDLNQSRLQDCVDFGFSGCSCSNPNEHRERITRASEFGLKSPGKEDPNPSKTQLQG
jgi:hypothetical protein